jgi:hypothetical protein
MRALCQRLPPFGPAAFGAWVLVLSGGCFGGSNDTGGANDDLCGDIDGDGSDTGDLPNVLGNWTTTFGLSLFDDTCNIQGINQDEMTWINGAAMEVDGRAPDQLYVTFDSSSDEKFWGVMNGSGGIVFTGHHEMEGYDLNVTFGGLLFDNTYQDRDQIQGHATMAIDSTGSGSIDCFVQGDFVAKKSGN